MNLNWNFDRALLVATLCLLAFGLMMVFSASTPISGDRFQSPHFLFYRQLAWAGVGLVAFLAAIHLRLRWLTNGWSLLAGMCVTYGLLGVVFLQSPINGTHRWVHAFGIAFQPSELAKFMTIFFLSWYLSRTTDLRTRPLFHLIRILAVLLPMLGLIALEPDLGSVVIILLFTGIYLFLADFPIKLLLAGALATVPALLVLVLTSSYQMQRIKTFLNPLADPQGRGYQILQSLIAIGHSGFWGLGFGESSQKMFFLPEPHTDFIYAVVGEELGFIGCAVLTALFVVLFVRGIRAATHSPTPLHCWLGLGLCALVMIEALINTSMVVNLGPTKGIPLPFVSTGGTSLLMSLLAMGLVTNISREAEE